MMATRFLKSNDKKPIYFMVQSASGKIHAINPKTQKTYCGNTTTFLKGWRSLDVVPSDQHQPTCKICQRHYDEPIKEQMRTVANELKTSIDDFLDMRIALKDVEGLGRFVDCVGGFIKTELKKAYKSTDVNP